MSIDSVSAKRGSQEEPGKEGRGPGGPEEEKGGAGGGGRSRQEDPAEKEPGEPGDKPQAARGRARQGQEERRGWKVLSIAVMCNDAT